MESVITIQMVHGGFIFTSEDNDNTNNNSIKGYKTEVFTSQAKLMKAIRASIEENSLVRKADGDKPEAK